MKVEAKEKSFQPIEIKLVIESKEELEALSEIYNSRYNILELLIVDRQINEKNMKLSKTLS